MDRVAERPIGVTIIAILLAINGIAAIIAALGLFGPVPGGTLAIALTVLLGLVLLYLAYGLWTLQPWAWLTTLLIEGVNALFSVISLVQAPGAIGAWITLFVAAIIIFYLTRPEVRAAFGRAQVGI